MTQNQQNQQKLRSTLTIAVAVAMLTGCGQGAAKQETRVAAPAAPTATGDVRACAGVQAVIGHLTAGTARWSPNLDPFDKAISSQIRLQSQNLARQVPLAKSKNVRAAVQSNARAFTVMADAMTGKDRDKVNRSINGTKVAYRTLKKVCELK